MDNELNHNYTGNTKINKYIYKYICIWRILTVNNEQSTCRMRKGICESNFSIPQIVQFIDMLNLRLETSNFKRFLLL